MPILAYWGLPVSLASPLGNILFHPLLTLFLFLSSLVFFCQVCHIPNKIFIYALEQTSHAFNYLLGLGSQQWLMGFAKPSLWILIFLPLATATMLCYKKTRTSYKNILSLLALFCLFSLYLKYTCHPCPITQIPCHKGILTLIAAKNQLILIDPGALGQCISAPTWVEFTLAPTIINLTGKTTLDHVIIMQPSQMSFEALAILCNVITIKNIYMPFWKGNMSKGQKRSYAKLMQAVKNQETKMIRLGRKMSLALDQDILCISPQEQVLTSQEMKYKAFVLTAHIGNFSTTCCSLKMDACLPDQRQTSIKKLLNIAVSASARNNCNKGIHEDKDNY